MKRDGRKLDHKTSEEIRKMAVKRVMEGEKPSAVAASFGMCRTAIHPWLRNYKKKGDPGLDGTVSKGRTPLLTKKQKIKIRTWICGKDPRQYGFDFGLWTRQIVKAMIKDRYKVDMSVINVGRLLAKLEITPQKPLRRAYQRDPVAIEKWKKEDFPIIRKRAKRQGANVFFLDEAGMRSDDPLGRSWGARGKTPVVKTTGQRQAISAISAISPNGAFWHNVYNGRLNAETFSFFLKDFIKSQRNKCFMIMDRHPAHISKKVTELVKLLKGKLEIYFLPGYAPELNPDEFVWNYIRSNGVSKTPLRAKESLKDRVEKDLRGIKSNRRLVKSFFQATSVLYVMY